MDPINFHLAFRIIVNVDTSWLLTCFAQWWYCGKQQSNRNNWLDGFHRLIAHNFWQKRKDEEISFVWSSLLRFQNWCSYSTIEYFDWLFVYQWCFATIDFTVQGAHYIFEAGMIKEIFVRNTWSSSSLTSSFFFLSSSISYVPGGTGVREVAVTAIFRKYSNMVHFSLKLAKEQNTKFVSMSKLWGSAMWMYCTLKPLTQTQCLKMMLSFWLCSELALSTMLPTS